MNDETDSARADTQAFRRCTLCGDMEGACLCVKVKEQHPELFAWVKKVLSRTAKAVLEESKKL